MEGNLRIARGIFRRLGVRGLNHRRIIVGLKSDNCSREMLMRLLHLVVGRGDSVVAIHVQQQSDSTFDPNTFHIHEDFCKSKQVDFEVKICAGSCYITELAHQVRITFATVLAMGCSSNCPKTSAVSKCLKALPPTCKLLIMDNGGKILYQEMGSSQQGSSSRLCRTLMSSLSESSSSDKLGTRPPVRKAWSMPSSSTSTSGQTESANFISAKNSQQQCNLSPKFFQRSAMLEGKEYNRRFTFEELNHATKNFASSMLIGEGAKSRVYQAFLENGQAVAVEVLEDSQYADEFFSRKVEVLNSLKHENIAQVLGYCYSKEMNAIVYNACSSSLMQMLNQLKWSERVQIAVGVAKALEYLHSCYPPIIHTDVNSSNVLLSEDGKPQLSNLGAAKVYFSKQQSSTLKRPDLGLGTLGYLAPEYVMYGKIDEKIDVYSYGTMLLELITGKESIRTNPASNQESLVLRARTLLACGLYERLIDPSLNEDYKKDEMKAMMIVARLCLLHSSSRRPTMKTILHFLQEPNYVLEIQKISGDLVEPENENDFSTHAKLDASDI